MAPGAYCYELARGRHLDAVLIRGLERGIEQVVFLGAGFETRPYRLRAEFKSVDVFEVDHPVTAEYKRRELKRVLGCLPSYVRYVEADLEGLDLGPRLRRAGFDENARTLFICSGVTGYLTEPAVDRMLRYVAASAPGSAIAFDYWHRAVIDGDYTAYGASQAVSRVTKLGEPYRSGIDPAELPAYLSDRGLDLDSDLDSAALQELYLRGSDGQLRGRPYGFLSIAHAKTRSRTDTITAHC